MRLYTRKHRDVKAAKTPQAKITNTLLATGTRRREPEVSAVGATIVMPARALRVQPLDPGRIASVMHSKQRAGERRLTIVVACRVTGASNGCRHRPRRPGQARQSNQASRSTAFRVARKACQEAAGSRLSMPARGICQIWDSAVQACLWGDKKSGLAFELSTQPAAFPSPVQPPMAALGITGEI